MPGRDLATLAKIASSLNYESEWKIYSEKIMGMPPRSYSYSFETRDFYFSENADHRKTILNNYADGSSPVYMIAIKDVYNAPLDYDDISAEIKHIVRSGRMPFVGCWYVESNVFRGVSILVNHGTSDDEILAMLADHDQKCAMKITLDTFTYVPPE